MANRAVHGFFKVLGVDLNASTVIADTNTDAVNVYEEAAEVFIFGLIDAISGTTPTCDIKMEYSPDNGTSWFDHPINRGTTNRALFSQVTTVDTETGMIVPIFGAGSGQVKIRLNIDVGGTGPNYKLTLRYAIRNAPYPSVV